MHYKLVLQCWDTSHLAKLSARIVTLTSTHYTQSILARIIVKCKLTVPVKQSVQYTFVFVTLCVLKYMYVSCVKKSYITIIESIKSAPLYLWMVLLLMW